MKRLALTAITALALLASSASASTPRPTCHWTQHKAGAVTVYVQVCKAPKHKKHAVNPRWTTAGPGNSSAPRIG